MAPGTVDQNPGSLWTSIQQVNGCSSTPTILNISEHDIILRPNSLYSRCLYTHLRKSPHGTTYAQTHQQQTIPDCTTGTTTLPSSYRNPCPRLDLESDSIWQCHLGRTTHLLRVVFLVEVITKISWGIICSSHQLALFRVLSACMVTQPGFEYGSSLWEDISVTYRMYLCVARQLNCAWETNSIQYILFFNIQDQEVHSSHKARTCLSRKFGYPQVCCFFPHQHLQKTLDGLRPFFFVTLVPPKKMDK